MNIIWQQPNGQLAVTSIFDGSDPKGHADLLQERGDVPGDWKAVAYGVEYFPQDWSRQEDWRFVKGAIVVDLTCAKESTKARLRVEREPFFIANDIALRDALLEGDEVKKTAAIAERDRLRNLPELADACATLDELKELTAK